MGELGGWPWATDPARGRFGAGRQPRRDGGRPAQAIVATPEDLVAVLLQPHAAWLRLQPFEPLLAELTVGDPPAPAVNLGAQEILEHAGLAGHQAVAMIGDRDGDTKGRVQVDGLASDHLLQALVAELHRLGAGRPRNDTKRRGADRRRDDMTPQQKTPVVCIWLHP